MKLSGRRRIEILIMTVYGDKGHKWRFELNSTTKIPTEKHRKQNCPKDSRTPAVHETLNLLRVLAML